MINLKSLVNIDRLAYPTYWVISLLNPLIRPNKNITPGQSEKVAIIKMLGIGSITRIYTTLKKNHIDLEQVELYTLSGNRELCEVLKIKNVQFIEVNGLFKFAISSLKAIRRIRRQKLKVIIDYERSSNLLSIFRVFSTFFTGTKTISFYNLKTDRKSSLDFQFRIKGRSIQELITLTIPFLPKSPNQQEINQISIADFIPKHSILININASDYMPHRKYSRERFAEVIKSLLAEDESLNIFLVGAPQEKGYVDAMIHQYIQDYSQVINCCGVWNLKQLISALDTCRLLITNDSGPMHLAVMRGVQTVVIWGPTTPDTFGYEDYAHVVNVQSGRSCAPCFTHPKSKAAGVCKGRIDCMRDIKPEQVSNMAIQLLTRQQVTA